MFIIGALQHVKIGDLTRASVSLDVAGEDVAMSEAQDTLPLGIEPGEGIILTRSEEAALTRASSTGFAGKLSSGHSFDITVL